MTQGSRVPEGRQDQFLAWRRLHRALRPRANRSQVIVALLCFVLGLSIAVQVRHQDEDALAGASQQELVRLLDESNRHVSELEVENGDLDRTLETLRESRSDDVAAQDAAENRRIELEILAGTRPAVGRGIQISITPGTGELRASTLLSVMQELRNAGAEVIQIDQVRVVTSTSVTNDDQGRLMVDGTPVVPPFQIRAIGDPTVMDPALRIPGGAADAVAGDGMSMSITAVDELRIDALAEPRMLRHAEVVK